MGGGEKGREEEWEEEGGDVFAAEKVRARGLLVRARREENGMGVRSAYDIARRVCTQPGQGLNSNWSSIRLGKVGRWKEGGRGRGEGECPSSSELKRRKKEKKEKKQGQGKGKEGGKGTKN